MGVTNIVSLAALRRRLVAVPFNVSFVEKEGNDGYQSRIRRLVSRAERPGRTAKSMLTEEALLELPSESIDSEECF